MVSAFNGGVFMNAKCPLCDSTTSEVVDPDSGDLKVGSTDCGGKLAARFQAIKVFV